MIYVLSFLTSYIVVYLLMPLAIQLSNKINFLDIPNKRKTHSKPMPLCGGIPIFVSYILTLLIFHYNEKYLSIVIGSSMILFIGIIDDWYKSRGKDFSVLLRLLIQISAALIIFNSGIRFSGLANPFNSSEYICFPLVVQLICTVLWIFGVTTVINFTDGLDGLASGISVISAMTLFLVALAKNQSDSAIMAIILVGVGLAFLKYNKFPAKSFLGDSGATFLGFMLAIISLEGAFKQATLISMFIPVIAIGIPIFDNLFVVVLRIKNNKPIYKADRSQMHYRLLDSGISQNRVIQKMYSISLMLGALAILLLYLNYGY